MVVGYVVALAPILLAIVLEMLAPSFFAPFFDDRISVAGMPAGLALLALIGGLTAIGVLVVRVFGSWLAIGVVVVICVMPASRGAMLIKSVSFAREETVFSARSRFRF